MRIADWHSTTFRWCCTFSFALRYFCYLLFLPFLGKSARCVPFSRSCFPPQPFVWLSASDWPRREAGRQLKQIETFRRLLVVHDPLPCPPDGRNSTCTARAGSVGGRRCRSRENRHG